MSKKGLEINATLDKKTLAKLLKEIKKVGAKPIADAIKGVFDGKTKDIRKDAKRNLSKGRVQEKYETEDGKVMRKRFGILTGSLKRHIWRGRFERRRRNTYLSAGVGIKKGNAMVPRSAGRAGPASMTRISTVKEDGKKVRKFRPIIPTNYAHFIEFGFRHRGRSIKGLKFMQGSMGTKHTGNYADAIKKTERAVKNKLGL